MEYIEPKPVEVDKKKKTRKRVIAGVTCGLVAAALVAGAAVLISKVFIEYDRIELYTFKYDDSDPKSGATISAVKESATLPKKLRLPNRYKKHPIVAIDDSVFLERKELQEIILPDSLTSIGVEAFLGCENLTKINVPKSLETIGTDAFGRTGWYNSFPSGDIVTFGDFLYSFKGQMAPHSGVFASHTSPKESYYSGNKVYLCDFTHYSQGVFKDQTNLEYAEIPYQTMTGVPNSFFEGCSSLEDIDLPASLLSIGNSAFKNCTNLHINGFNNLINLNSIGNYALANTKLSGDIVFNNIIADVGEGVFKDCTSLTSVTVGDGFRNIPNEFVQGCTSLTALNLPSREETVESRISFIGEHALSGTKINEFTVPFNTITVRQGAFKECPDLVSVYLYANDVGSKLNRYDPDTNTWIKSDTLQGVQAIEQECFKESPLFKELILVDSNNVKVTLDDMVSFPFTLSYLGSINERSDLFTGTSVVGIDFEDANISTLAPNLCENATSLQHVYFGDYSRISKFNTEAFKGCTSLVDIKIPDSVKSIEAGVFDGCTSLASVTLSKNATSIPDFTFRNCTSLTSVFVPFGYKSFGKEAFKGCTSLSSFIFEENIINKGQAFANLGESCFEGCVALTSISIPNGCKQYAKYVFRDTQTLTTLTLSSNRVLSTVSENMFEQSSIESIYLPANYKNISRYAFKDSSLTTITMACSSVVKVANINAFEGVSLEHIYVPSSLVDSYKNNAIWSNYESIIEGVSEATITFEAGTYGKGTMSQLVELVNGFVALPANGFSSTDDSKVFKCYEIGGAEYNPGDIVALTGDTTVTAIWQDATSATISYDANGGTGTMPSDVANVGESYLLPTSEFTREGYDFAGWIVSTETMIHDAGDIITITGDTTIYPLWSEQAEPVDPDTPSEDDSGETNTKEEEAKKFPVAAIVILSIAGTAVVGLLLFYIIRAIVLKKIYG